MRAKRETVSADIDFRIRVAVTGQRVLENRDRLSQKIMHILNVTIYDLFDKPSRKIIRSSPHVPIAFSVVTSLREGAERLVAREVLKRTNSRLEVVLPLTREDYLQDFSSPESRQDFEELLHLARQPISLKVRRLEEESARGDLQAVRRQAYADAGQYIVDHCDVLIALGDRAATGGDHYAWDTVEYAKTRERPVVILATAPPYDLSITAGHGLTARSIPQLELFNAWPITLETQRSRAESERHQVFDSREGRDIAAAAKTLVQQHLIPHYVRASEIAEHHQKVYIWTALLVYGLSSAAVAMVAVGTMVHAFAPYAFGMELGLLAAILLLWRHAHRGRTHSKWVESRFLAERLRHGMFLATCGVEVARARIPPYMGAADTPDEWMTMAFDEIWNRLPVLPRCQEQACAPLVDFVRVAWVGDQIKYHERNTTKMAKMSRRLERTGILFFSLAMAAAVGHLGLPLLTQQPTGTWYEGLLTFVAIVAPAVGAAIGGYRAHRECSRLARRSRNMAAALRDLDRRFAKVKTPQALETMLHRTEDLMLRETQDWLMLMGIEEGIALH